MPIYSCVHRAPVSTDPFVNLKTAATTIDGTNTQVPCGSVDAFIYTEGAVAFELVFNVASAGAAATEQGAFRTFKVSAATRIPFAIRFDPNTTWVRSTGALQNFWVTYQW